jgi:hypothetical protein
MAVLTWESDKPDDNFEEAEPDMADKTTAVRPEAEPGYSESAGEGGPGFGERARGLSAAAWAAIALGVVLAALVTYSLLRIAGEEHYQSCVSAVNGRYGTASDPLTRLARVNSVKACSRSPF